MRINAEKRTEGFGIGWLRITGEVRPTGQSGNGTMVTSHMRTEIVLLARFLFCRIVANTGDAKNIAPSVIVGLFIIAGRRQRKKLHQKETL